MNHDKYRIHINKVNEKIIIDGLLEENIWQVAEKAVNFYRVTPTDTGYAIAQTVAMVAYDDDNIYMAAVCYAR
jgi:hypothetical protein